MKLAQWLVENERYVNGVCIVGILAGLGLDTDRLTVASVAALGFVTGYVVPKSRSFIDSAAFDARMKAFDERMGNRRGAADARMMVLGVGFAIMVAIFVWCVRAVFAHL